MQEENKTNSSEDIISERDAFSDSQNRVITKFPMKEDLNFIKTSMPESRKADYHFSYYDYSVIIDFNKKENNKIYLVRISFDGFGCCEIGSKSIPLNIQESHDFRELMNFDNFDQKKLNQVIRKSVKLNQNHIWKDALFEYKLTEKYNCI